jgi:hypothetical protein
VYGGHFRKARRFRGQNSKNLLILHTIFTGGASLFLPDVTEGQESRRLGRGITFLGGDNNSMHFAPSSTPEALVSCCKLVTELNSQSNATTICI